MKKTTHTLSRRAAVMAVLLIPCAYLNAQTAAAPAAAAPAKDEEVILLTPFEVTVEGNDGYTADAALTGNRLRTDIRDIGSSLSVVTPQFLKDTGATDNTSLLIHLGGAEVGGVNGNFASAAGDSSATLRTEDTVRPTEGTRIRGLAAADNTRDFFVSDIPWDSYNTDSIQLQRGPNSILFGQGSPAGIINASSKGASFRNSGELEARYGSFGSWRVSLDLNQVLLKDQVAFRLDLLSADDKFKQKPAFSKDQRISAAIRIDPEFLRKNGNHTIIKANFEYGQIDSDNPRALPPTDHITPFFDPNAVIYTKLDANGKTIQVPAGTAGATAVPGSGAYHAGLSGPIAWMGNVPGGLSTAANGYADAGRAEFTQSPDPYFTGGQIGNSGFPLNVIQNANTVGSAGQYRFTSINQNMVAGNTVTLPYGSYPSSWLALTSPAKQAVFAGLPFSNGGLFTENSITNPSIFNFYNNLIDGNLKKEWQKFWQGTINLSQTFLNDQVGFSLDYNKQHYEYGALNPFGGAVPLYVDVMKTNNDGVPTAAELLANPLVNNVYASVPANATPNPNYGRPFIISAGGNFNNINDREDKRATAFVTHNFKKDSSAMWATILGTQTLTGLLDDAKLDTSTMSWQRYGYLGNNLTLANAIDGGGSTAPNPTFAAVNPQQVIYLGPVLTDQSITGGNISRITGNPTVGNQSINYFSLTPDPAGAAFPATDPRHYVGWAGTNTTLVVTDSEANPLNRAQLATAYGKTRTETTSQALVYQGKWLDNALVGMYGWRKDITKSSAMGANLGDANDQQNINFGLVDLNGPGATLGRVEVQSRSYSLVAHLDELPGVKDFASKIPVKISLAYNVSTNFQPDSSRVDINGDPLAPPSGKTIERGILLETRDGKYSLKINRYVTTIINGEYAGGTTFAHDLANWVGFTTYYNNVFYYRTNQGTAVQGGPGSVAAFNPGVGPDGGPLGAGKYEGGASAAGYYYDAAQYHTAAMEALQVSSTQATRDWETQINKDFPNFFKNWGMNSLAEVQAGTVPQGQLKGIPGETNFALSESSESKGWEFELNAQPTKDWRISFNATKTDAVITALGDPALAKFMADTSAYLNNAGGTTQWFWGNSVSPGVPNAKDGFYNAYNPGWGAIGPEYAGLVQSQGIAASQMAKWRYNLTTNYDFSSGGLKGFNVGGGVRYTSSEIIGYPPQGTGTVTNPDGTISLANPPFLADHTKPYMSPSETYFDLWIGYKHKLTNKINWNIQLNIANVGKNNYLIPVSYQAPILGVAHPAFYRIGPTQTFTLRNSFEF